MAKQRTPTLATPIAPLNDQSQAQSSGSKTEERKCDHEGVIPFRPTVRPPAGNLILVDDDSQTGELIRLTNDRTTIGREGTDVRISHDGQISRLHAEILRIRGETGFRWFLKDCKSSNGTFVRVQRTRVRAEQELLLGAKRYCFRQAEDIGTQQDPKEPPTNLGSSNQTSVWQVVDPSAFVKEGPALVEKLPDRSDGITITLSGSETILGCSPALKQPIQDQCLNPEHAIMRRIESGEWIIEDLHSLNGVWIRINRLELADTCEFQIGEQRILFHPPR